MGKTCALRAIARQSAGLNGQSGLIKSNFVLPSLINIYFGVMAAILDHWQRWLWSVGVVVPNFLRGTSLSKVRYSNCHYIIVEILQMELLPSLACKSPTQIVQVIL